MICLSEENKELINIVDVIHDLKCQVLDSIKRKGIDHKDTIELSGKLNRAVLRTAMEEVKNKQD